MPRVTISIPADLRDRLRHPSVKKALNVSRVCQEALNRQVQRLLELPVEVERMESLLARLRRDRDTVHHRWFSEGATAGRDWVEHQASHAELFKLGEAEPLERIRLLQSGPPDQLKQDLEQQRTVPGFSEQAFLEGWAHVIGLLWQVIKRNL